MRLLIIEDDGPTARLYHLALTGDGHVVDVATGAEEGSLMAATTPYDGIVLDLGLRDGHGLQLLAEWRRRGITTPILICTGKDAEDDVVRGLNAGADEYVVKPVSMPVLRARVRALLRRSTRGPLHRDQLLAGNVHLDRLARQLRVNGVTVSFTQRELALLEFLLLRPQTTVSRTELLEKIWEVNFDPGTNVVDVLVARVRRKLSDAGATVSIQSIRGVGFLLAISESDAPPPPPAVS